MGNPANSGNKYDANGAVNKKVEPDGRVNLYVGNGFGHSHTVFDANGQLLYDRDANGNIFTGNPPGAMFPPVPVFKK